MKEIKYRYCVDENDNLVFIENMSNENRHSHKLYCLGCGNEMVANLGTKKTWYFSHKTDCACDGESYLHKLAKRRICEKFNNSDSFPITFVRDVPCSEIKNCFFADGTYCKTCGVENKMNLKKWEGKTLFDKCVEECPTGGFKPDLILTSTSEPSRKPIFIEIFKTHLSEEPKMTSGNKIIETKKIETEKDIDDIILEGFVEGKNCSFTNFEPHFEPIRKKDVPITRFLLNQYGSASVKKNIDSGIYCYNKNLRLIPYSIYELNLKGGVIIYGTRHLDNFQLGLLYLWKRYKNRNCIICEHYRFNTRGRSYICIKYKCRGKENPEVFQTEYKDCVYFNINPLLDKYSLEYLEKHVAEVK